jgi:hypothetical protein
VSRSPRRFAPLRFASFAAFALSTACTVPMSRSPDGERPEGYAVTLEEPFDNSRDWGPGYLVGPPLRPKLYSNDHGNRTADSVLHPGQTPDSAPSIPTRTQDSAAPAPPH